MTTFKSDFQPTMKKGEFILKILLLLAGIGFIVKTFAAQSLNDQIASFLLGTILIFVFLYLQTIIPVSINLDNGGIIIRRTFGEKRIPYSIIKDAFVYNEVQSDIRHFGSNGFLGYVGIMESTTYGRYYSYVKNPQQQVFILTSKKNYLLSCADRDLFIRELKKRIS